MAASPPARPVLRRRLLVAGLLLILLVVLFRLRFLVTAVTGQSMSPNLEPGDLLLIDKHAYRQVEPQRGDLVVARVRNDLLVKRVVALPGELAEVKHGVLYINGEELSEKQSTLKGELDIGTGRLSRDKFAILGDNRTLPVWWSVFAIVSKEQIVGKVVGHLHW